MRRSWDIFCSVVDNFGDIGVCWRLARRLSSGLGYGVRLWVDDLESFRRLRPDIDTGAVAQCIDNVEVRRWGADFPDVVPADIVVEGFGVRLPDAYIAAMVARKPSPVWINLEYLSAEAWVDSHHGMQSPHPRLSLTKYFFFPGFTASTGGILIEDGLVDARNALQTNEDGKAAFRRAIGIAPSAAATRAEALWISIFCYENAALPGLIAAWADDARRIQCVVPEGRARSQLERIVGRSLAFGEPVEIGQLTLHAVPFLAFDDYDRLLWSCDLNFVRGEDSFARAQLAARPLVWQAYPQDADAHLKKAAAFSERYMYGMEEAAALSAIRLFDGWNRQAGDCGSEWTNFANHLATYSTNAVNWAERVVENGDLAVNLAKFCEDRIE